MSKVMLWPSTIGSVCTSATMFEVSIGNAIVDGFTLDVHSETAVLTWNKLSLCTKNGET